MSNTITLDQARESADQLVEIAEQLSDFRFKNFETLTDSERTEIRLKISSIRRMANDMTALIVGQTLQNLTENLKIIIEATKEAEKDINKINEVKKILNIAAAVIKLSAAIITLNPVAILSAAGEVISSSK